MFFGKSFKTEIETDYSKIFQTIREVSIGLDAIKTSDENAYEENMRFALGQNPKHVIIYITLIIYTNKILSLSHNFKSNILWDER